MIIKLKLLDKAVSFKTVSKVGGSARRLTKKWKDFQRMNASRVLLYGNYTYCNMFNCCFTDTHTRARAHTHTYTHVYMRGRTDKTAYLKSSNSKWMGSVSRSAALNNRPADYSPRHCWECSDIK